MGQAHDNVGITDGKFPAPVFEGDTVRVETEIIGARESKSRKDAGIVDFFHRAYKQDGTLVASVAQEGSLRQRKS